VAGSAGEVAGSGFCETREDEASKLGWVA